MTGNYFSNLSFPPCTQSPNNSPPTLSHQHSINNMSFRIYSDLTRCLPTALINNLQFSNFDFTFSIFYCLDLSIFSKNDSITFLVSVILALIFIFTATIFCNFTNFLYFDTFGSFFSIDHLDYISSILLFAS